MSDPNPKVLAQLNALAEQRFKLAAEEEDLDRQQATDQARLDAEYTRRRASLKARIAPLDTEIDKLIEANRPDLILLKKQSFSIERAKFLFTKHKAMTKVANKDGVMQVARRLGVVRQIAKPPKQVWKFEQAMFFAWLARHDELRHWFQPHLEEIEASESLHMEPNTGYTVQHGKHRISPPKVKIKS